MQGEKRDMMISLHTIEIYFLLFLIYSFLGWLMETTIKSIGAKKFVNRGFLIGPCCSIYGYGALLITFLLKNYTRDPVVLFFMAVIICGILEYVTSYVMEKLFHARWWDYSSKKYNINGRVCLETIIPFGILGLIIMYIGNPFFLSYLNELPEIAIHILSGILLVIYIVDNILSFKVVFNLRSAVSKSYQEIKDNTEEISEKVRQMMRQRSILHRRFINAFPGLEAKKKEIKRKIEQKKLEIKESVKNLKQEKKENSKKDEK